MLEIINVFEQNTEIKKLEFMTEKQRKPLTEALHKLNINKEFKTLSAIKENVNKK